MGSFYSNIHLRCTDRTLVERAWQSYWDGRGETAWVFISPAYNGWISVFDWRCDQQDVDVLTDLSSHLSRALECVALSFQLQDSDLAEYWLFHRGDELDHYTSDAEYFAAYAQRPEVTPEQGVYSGFGPDTKEGYALEEDLSDGGNEGLLKSLTGTEASEAELDAILRTPAVIADDILTALASTIGINDMWASLGYHYLVIDSDTIPAINQFTHLPTGVPPNPTRFEEH